MFVDKVSVTITAGDGGDGLVSFRHEKYIEKGGPDGGDGGDGGDVVAVASNSENTLAKFRYDRRIEAEAGVRGDKRKKHGKRGANLYLMLPVGTVVLRDGQVVADLTEVGQEVKIAEGGKGGFGNAHFTSSVRQAPRIAEKGELGDGYDAILELKTIADVGIIGLPNAGKSTLLSVISNAKPEIANYPFTTLVPNLGVVDIDKNDSLLMADIPGLIEGASEGKGLGDEFLRHVERTKVLLHLIDAYSDDVVASYKTIRSELKAYSKDFAKQPEIVALTKIEGLDDEIINDQIAQLRAVVPKKTLVMAISSSTKTGVKDLLYALQKMVRSSAAKTVKSQEIDAITVIRPNFDVDAWVVTKTPDGPFVVTGRKIERFASRTRFDNDFSMMRLRDILRKMGIMRELKRQGLEAGDTIQIGKNSTGSFEF